MYIDCFINYTLVALLCNNLLVCQEFEWGGCWDVGLFLAYLPIIWIFFTLYGFMAIVGLCVALVRLCLSRMVCYSLTPNVCSIGGVSSL